eukprot:CAMPEP_0194106396 /NCGR_PEP_ID=MMETSP0150-20130528/6417_1 /TAXON_ID=122233 /ORGANISM="Chaetoceros debilis, Strain MM31A-1" /LENGTH=448 /DNA_ID=CAMNT_0038794525 /DNA_START=83 /DNA_END=1429 /DNA_ORIENTATION=+
MAKQSLHSSKMFTIPFCIILGAATICFSRAAAAAATSSGETTTSSYIDETCIDPEASANTNITADTTISDSDISASPLAKARTLKAPLASATEDAEFEHSTFWEDNGSLLKDAWAEWEEEMHPNSFQGAGKLVDGSFINPVLSMALEDAFSNPSELMEASVKSNWMNSNHDEEHHPTLLPKGVYTTQLLTPSGVSHIRTLLDMATTSGIPTRRPNGMNRHGIILDPNVDGAVPVKALLNLVEEELNNRVVRPVGRMLFPDRVGCEDDLSYFAFTIRYDGSEDDDNDNDNDDNDESSTLKRDVKLKEHRDASIVTLNINLNLPEEGYTGSEVYFRDFPSADDDSTDSSVPENNYERDVISPGDDKNGGTVQFSPGMAIIHLGAHRHGSMPISLSADSDKNSSSKRYNLVIWLFGEDGDVRIAPYEKEDQMTVAERWRGCNHTQEVFAFN